MEHLRGKCKPFLPQRAASDCISRIRTIGEVDQMSGRHKFGALTGELAAKRRAWIEAEKKRLRRATALRPCPRVFASHRRCDLEGPPRQGDLGKINVASVETHAERALNRASF